MSEPIYLVKFPDLESVRKHREVTNRFYWSRYVKAISVLGIDALEEQ